MSWLSLALQGYFGVGLLYKNGEESGFRVLMTYGTNARVLDKTCVMRNLQEAIRMRLARTCPRAATGATRVKRRRNLAFKTFVF